jgi:hypothetical protein
VTDTATVSGGDNPGGTIEFQLYGPSATPVCSGTPVDDETVTVSGNGSYTTPAGATPAQAGTYWWTASYSGDANNSPAATNCGDESVVLTATPHLYWADQSGGTVDEANLDGSNPHAIIIDQPFPAGVAVNDTSLYWDTDPGELILSNLNGTGGVGIGAGLFGTPRLLVLTSTRLWVAVPGEGTGSGRSLAST